MDDGIKFDVYNSPRMSPHDFARYCVADGRERETVLRNAKYIRRGFKPRAWKAKIEIDNFLTSPNRSTATLVNAIRDLEALTRTLNDRRIDEANASIECLNKFVDYVGDLDFLNKEIIGVDGEANYVLFDDLKVPLALSALVLSRDRNGAERVGGVYLTTRAGEGLGKKDTTRQKRSNVGELIALMAFKQLLDYYSDVGAPYPNDTYHIYVRHKHFWKAPTRYASKLANLEAHARAICQLWPSVAPPPEFDPLSAHFH